MRPKFLIDECLTPSLVGLAHAAGYEATCVRDLGQASMKDWELVQYAVAGDFILVTNNSRDFRGRSGTPGGLYGNETLHPGLLCINSERGLVRERQRELFQEALAFLPEDMVNRAFEVWELADGQVEFEEYEIPSP